MDTAERRATGALWSIQGVGPVTLREIRERVGPLGELLDLPVSSWAPLVPWRGEALAQVMSLGRLSIAADRLEQRCKVLNAKILFSGDAAFPSRLDEIPNPPPLLFAFGPAASAPPRRRLAIVGTRELDQGSLDRIREVANEAARYGLGIVSGAARGVDQWAHTGAVDVKGETWAFLGSALDEIDSEQRGIVRAILKVGGTVFSQFPPGFRANTNSFTQRNRLISGASDAVLVFRAPEGSGALHTANAALEQGRPLLATPGGPLERAALRAAIGCSAKGEARPHLDVGDLLQAVGLTGSISPLAPVEIDLSELSALAAQVLAELSVGRRRLRGPAGRAAGLDIGATVRRARRIGGLWGGSAQGGPSLRKTLRISNVDELEWAN